MAPPTHFNPHANEGEDFGSAKTFRWNVARAKKFETDSISDADGANVVTPAELFTAVHTPSGTQGNQGSQGAAGTGCQGNQGLSGPQGNQGIAGTDGVQGNQGNQGAVGTGGQGNQGLEGPQGNQGDLGTQGFQGAVGTGGQGNQGNQGLEGVQGNQGFQGIAGTGGQGYQGLAGPQGNQGDLGTDGTQGFQGNVGSGGQGNQGNQGLEGLQGNQGFQGTTGTGGQGNQGLEGPQGNQGAAGDGAQGNQGFEGSQGNQGAVGDGTQGNQGNQGAAGTGTQGNQGLEGPQGNQGNQGATGDGTQGNQGLEGSQGNQGNQGLGGVQGNQGNQGNQGIEGPGADQELNTTSSPSFLNETINIVEGSELAPAMTGVNWTGGADWTIAGSAATHAATGSNTLYPTTPIVPSTSKRYKVTFTTSGWSAGSYTMTLGGVVSTPLAGDQNYSLYVDPFTTDNLIFTPTADFVGAISAVTCKEITQGILTVYGDIIHMDSRGHTDRLGHMVRHLSEMGTDTLLDKSRSSLSCSGGVLTYTLYAIYGKGTWNFNGIIYPMPVASASINLVGGTDAAPKQNYVYFYLVGDTPTLAVSETEPATAGHIHVAHFIVGAVSGSTYTMYSYYRKRDEVDSFVNRTITRFSYAGPEWVSGGVPTVTSTTLSIASGCKFIAGVFPYTAANTVTEAGFYWIDGAGGYHYSTTIADLNEYGDPARTALAATHRQNIVWGIVPTTTTAGGTAPVTVKLFAVLQGLPNSPYTSDATARADAENMTAYSPPDVELKKVFLPVARTIVRPSVPSFQTFSTGVYHRDLRGTACGASGATGAEGAQGPQGNQGSGIQGNQGLAGAQGNQGIGGVQGNQGFQGAVGTGTQGNQGLEGPQGNQGFQGAVGTGTQGNQGLEGPQGNQGNQGNQGATGDGTQGNQGSQGNQGNQGNQGAVGDGTQGNQGLEGPQGNQGNQGVAGDGTQGNQGLEGPQGNQGNQGNQGFQGAVGTGTQGNQGFEGPQGNQGFQGAVGDGTQGNQGSQGNQGNQGNQGAVGDGTQGNQGLEGPQGNQGNQGNQGLEGTQGFQGLEGPQGNQGNQGWQGNQGNQGVVGSGAQGNQGFEGSQGNQGLEGTQGFQGTQGNQGNQGNQGLAVARVITAVFDGGTVAPTAGTKCYWRVPYAGTITKATMLGNQSGSAVVDVWVDSFANYPPTVLDTITASAKPTLSSALASEDDTLTGWDTGLGAGEVVAFNLDSCTTITRLTVELDITP